jgi:hypothetical protein
MDFFQLIGWATGVSVLVSGLLTWLFKLGVEKAIDRELQRDFESYKNTLLRDSQQQLERLKSELQSRAQEQLERLRSELNARNEILRAEIQKQLIRAQLTTAKTHEAYAQLLRLLRLAEEAVAIDRVQHVVRRKGERDISVAISDARTFVLREALFLTVPVRDCALDICMALDSAYTAAQIHTQQASDTLEVAAHYQKTLNHAARGLRQLEELMRKELQPVFVRPPSHLSETASPMLDSGQTPSPALAAPPVTPYL